MRATRILILAILLAALSPALAQVPAVNSGTATYPSSGTLAVMGVAVKLLSFVVGSLPTCNGGSAGVLYMATDLLTPTALGIAIGGGAIIAPVLCNGTNWISIL